MRLLIVFVLLYQFSYAQVETIANLPFELQEISGLEQLNDTTFIAINDGGDAANIYLLNLKGEIFKTINVYNAKNKDWEDLTRDSTHLFIADLGNNRNSRHKLKIYKVKLKHLLTRDSVKASTIKISYADQLEFPATDANANFDVEAIAYAQDSIWIFTKCNDSPWTGYSKIYKVATKKGKYILSPLNKLYLGKNGYFFDATTAADIYDDTLYLMTYTHLYIYANLNDLTFVRKYGLGIYSQKESIVKTTSNCILIADERRKLLGGRKLYKLKKND